MRAVRPELAKRRQASGFTLIELLIAVAIFSAIGISAYTALDGLSKASESAERFDDDLGQLQRATARLDGDIQALIMRPKWDPSRPPLGDFVGRATSFGGVRAGWANPLAQPRAALQRFQWQWQNNRLERLYWPQLHGQSADAVRVETVLESVTDWTVRYFDPQRGWRLEWAPTNDRALPRAIEYAFVHPRFGHIRRVLVID